MSTHSLASEPVHPVPDGLIPEPLEGEELGAALITIRDGAEALHQKLEALWMTLDDDVLAAQLWECMDYAMIHAGLADAVQQRITRLPMITDLGRRIDQGRIDRLSTECLRAAHADDRESFAAAMRHAFGVDIPAEDLATGFEVARVEAAAGSSPV